MSCMTISSTLSPFNRTSMESKQPCHQQIDLASLPFNRTSMESKPTLQEVIRLMPRRLLIELVWNRNSIIEQVTAGVRIPFNRTSMESKRVQSFSQ